MSTYWHFARELSSRELSRMPASEQVELMRQWFLTYYEDPAECCPYESREGGYQWIWGYPAQPEEVLKLEFGGIASDEAIKDLVEELEAIAIEWSPAPEHEPDDLAYATSIQSDEDPLITLTTALDRIDRMITSRNSEPDEEQAFLQLALVGVVAAVEAFFSDLFLARLVGNEEHLRSFVENNPEMRKRRLSLAEVFSRQEHLEDEVRVYLASFPWHRLTVVCEMYKATFGIKFPNYFPELSDAIGLRHDIVHRGGKTQSGDAVTVDPKQLTGLIDMVRHRSGELKEAVFYEPF